MARPEGERRGPVDDPIYPEGYLAPRSVMPSRAELAEMQAAIEGSMPEPGQEGGAMSPAQERADYRRAFLDARPDFRQREGQQTPEGRETLYGRVVSISANLRTQGVWTPLEETEHDWMVTVQPQGILFDSSDLNSLRVDLQWMVGGATFSKIAILRKSVIARFPVTARRVLVDLTGINVGDPSFAGKTFQIALAVARGSERQVDSLSPLWQPLDQGMAASYILLPSPNGYNAISSGYLMSAVCIAKALPAGGPFYPMFFDDIVLPVNGAPPMLVLSPLAVAGDVASADDEFVSSWAFGQGLTFGLSTTPEVFTAPGAGGLIRVDFKVGT